VLLQILGDKDMEYEEQRTHMKTLHELLREKENRIEQLETTLSEGNQFRMSLDEMKDKYSELQVKFMEQESELEEEKMKSDSLEEELAKTKGKRIKFTSIHIKQLRGIA
jgi:predicted RNase H-like nuclease (RuvC/YqgF family)